MLAGCNNHPTVKATIHCSQCHKPICDRCIINGRFCSNACGEKFSKFTAGYQKSTNTRGSGIVPTLFFLLVVGAAVYASKYYFHWW